MVPGTMYRFIYLSYVDNIILIQSAMNWANKFLMKFLVMNL